MSARESKAVRREQIISAIAKIVATRGLSRLTTAALAREVGLTEGALFKHFATKEEMLKAAIREAGYGMVDRVAQIATGTLSPEEKIKCLLDFHVGLWEANPEVCRFVLRTVFSGEVYSSYPRLKGLIKDIMSKYVGHVEAVFREGEKRGSFHLNYFSAEKLSYLWVALLQGTFVRWHLQERKPSLKEEAEQIFQAVMLLAGKKNLWVPET